MELRMKEVRCFEVEYDDLDKFINDLFFEKSADIFSKFEFAEDHEVSNDSSYTFNIDGKVDKWEQKDIKQRKLKYMARNYLNEACRTGKIPKGQYLIKVSW